MRKTPHLCLVADGTPPIVLPLTDSPLSAVRPADERSARFVYSDRPYRFELVDFDIGAFTATLFINGELVPAQTVLHENGTLSLFPQSSPLVFENVFGFVQIEFLIAKRGFQGTVPLFAAPLEILLPEGPATDNITAMGNVVAADWLRVVGSESERFLTVSTEKEDSLSQREKLFEDILRIYESQYPYFRTNARFTLTRKASVEGTAKLRDFNAETARFVATHPEELIEAPNGTGIRIGNRNFLPMHTLVHRNIQNRNTEENRLTAGFLLTVLKGIDSELETAGTILKGTSDNSFDGQYKSGNAALRGIASKRIGAYAEKLLRFKERFREMYFHYRNMIGTDVLPVLQAPAPTPVLLSIPAYRLVFDAVVRWFDLPELSFEAQEAMIASMDRSLLYEYFSLIKLLEGFLSAGGTVLERSNFHYSGIEEEHILTDHPNTFRFAFDDRIVTLYYQPVIHAGSDNGENGILLMRRSSWSMSSDGVSLHPCTHRFYTPDFLIQSEKNGKTVCFILDAKYSSLEKVRNFLSVNLVFRYLFSIAPSRADVRVEGLWILCGNSFADSVNSALLADIDQPAGMPQDPNVHYVRLDGLDDAVAAESARKIIEAVLSV